MHAIDPSSASAAPGRETWRAEYSAAVRDPEELLRRLALPGEWLPAARRAAAAFPLLVPEPFLRRMEPGNPWDPLLRQVLPLGEELETAAGYTTDPLQEGAAQRDRGLLHKYTGRSLVVATGACAINCRYCFRRHFPYSEEAGWRAAIEALERGREDAPDELILSGGDPLTLDDEALDELLRRAARLSGLRRLRVHTRLPVVLPARVTARLEELLKEFPHPVVVVVHANHPREIDGEVAGALQRLRRATGALLNQSVLLRGVNDEAATLAELSEKLFSAGCLPYYLHLLDPVSGAAHFEVPEDEGQRIADALAGQLPGYLVPRLAREEPGAPAKRVIAPEPPAPPS